MWCFVAVLPLLLAISLRCAELAAAQQRINGLTHSPMIQTVLGERVVAEAPGRHKRRGVNLLWIIADVRPILRDIRLQCAPDQLLRRSGFRVQ